MAKAAYIGVGNFAGGRSLPSGYTQVEYIESSGTQYIDTEFKPDNNTRLTGDFEVTASGASYRTIFGAREGGLARCFSLFVSSTNRFYSNIGSGGNTYTFDSSLSGLGRHSVDANKNVVTIDDVSYTHLVEVFKCASTSIYLCASNENGTAGLLCSMRWYSCQIYDNGTLVRDFVPCKDANGAIGLYDLIHGKFHVNVGSGSFTEGVAYKSVARKIKRGYIGVGIFPSRGLPTGYTQVEYIETSGTQYINTKFVCNGNSKIEAEFEVLDASNNGAYLYGGGSGSARIEAYPWAGTMEMNYGSLAPFVGSLVANKKFYICQDKGNFHFSYPDGSGSWTQEGETQTFDCVVPMAIFVLNRGSIYYPIGGMRLYYFKIYDNGIIVRDLVPCVNSAGIAGLYDVVGQTFYGNSGTGVFTTGATLVEVARHIKKGYIGIGGVARQFLSDVDPVLNNMEDNP